ncbi:hypothetical protein BN1088_1433019 [Sphingobacterium sp. PM2-P1-29]|nr:hypothetical protein BN1088_1433019 [Sphingobacterium sp. PM2-P1-29]
MSQWRLLLVSHRDVDKKNKLGKFTSYKKYWSKIRPLIKAIEKKD